ncbi:MAG TPA: VOC family protein [Terriglobales bacterium]
MSSPNAVPIVSLFEAHLSVRDLDRAVGFYRDELGLALAHLVAERRVAFFWVGAPGKAMLGLWEAGTMPMALSLHVAFQVSLAELHQAPARLQQAGIQPRDFDDLPAREPVVLAWMPAAAVYFHDPDHNLLEFLAMLPDEPRPDLGVLPWSEWVQRNEKHQQLPAVAVLP